MSTKQNRYSDTKLSSGRVITHRYVSEDVLEGVILGDEDGIMTDAEYKEYCDLSLIDTQARHKQFLADRKQRNHELFEIAKHKHLIGKYARSIESGWYGKVTDIEYRGGDVLCKMIGVDELAVTVAGISNEEALASNDIQWFAPEDLRFRNSL